MYNAVFKYNLYIIDKYSDVEKLELSRKKYILWINDNNIK